MKSRAVKSEHNQKQGVLSPSVYGAHVSAQLILHSWVIREFQRQIKWSLEAPLTTVFFALDLNRFGFQKPLTLASHNDSTPKLCHYSGRRLLPAISEEMSIAVNKSSFFKCNFRLVGTVGNEILITQQIWRQQYLFFCQTQHCD